MNSMKRQQGASAVFWLLFAALLAFLFVVGIRLFPVYLQGYSVKGIIESVVAESRGQNWKRTQYWDKLSKRFDVNSINGMKKEYMTYKREKGAITITFKYEDRFNLLGNLDGVAVFDFTESTSTSGSE